MPSDRRLMSTTAMREPDFDDCRPGDDLAIVSNLQYNLPSGKLLLECKSMSDDEAETLWEQLSLNSTGVFPNPASH